jgi:hypothetical protein
MRHDDKGRGMDRDGMASASASAEGRSFFFFLQLYYYAGKYDTIQYVQGHPICLIRRMPEGLI